MDDESWEEMQKKHDKEWERLQWENTIPFLLLIGFLLALFLAVAIVAGWR